MEKILWLRSRRKLLLFSVSAVLLLLFPVIALPLDDEGKAMMSIKASFGNVANVLLDWDDTRDGDHCSWQGVFCDNVNYSVVSLNLSNLNLGGEISPAIGELRNLQFIDVVAESDQRFCYSA